MKWSHHEVTGFHMTVIMLHSKLYKDVHLKNITKNVSVTPQTVSVFGFRDGEVKWK